MHLKELVLSAEEAFNELIFEKALYEKAGVPFGSALVQPVRRSIDARGKNVVVRVQVEISSETNLPGQIKREYPDVSDSKPVVIVGAGPAGLFAALRLIELGMKPIVLERGKDVRSRRRDIAAINKEHIVNPDSNYCFGEGGAGTYSDGKLYTRSKKRGAISRILDTMVYHGAPKEIIFDAHPHIGTNKLPQLVEQLRRSVENAGGEVLFNHKVVDLLIEKDEIRGVVVQGNTEISGDAVILATGHSARDVFRLLASKNIFIEPKAFALGVRVEHQQQLIDNIQYHCADRGPYLPASSYSLVHQAKVNGVERGIFSFCMCPGGFIVPAATAPDEVVVNGMSPSKRDSKFANSGIVIGVSPADFGNANDPLAGMKFQEAIEKKACISGGGGGQTAPAQRLIDFIDGKLSTSLRESSYQPGLSTVNMDDILPDFIVTGLKQGLRNFGAKMNGFITNEAQVVGVESRTSSPVRVPRDNETLEHVQVKRLFPCGEGAGYAGGIMSAAIDGERCAEAVVKKYKNK